MRLKHPGPGVGALIAVVVALVPLSAYAEDGNQAAIDKAKAERAYLQNMPALEQGVTLGQLEIANARAIAKLLYYDGHAQTELPNSMQQYTEFCSAAIQQMQANFANANAMASEKPWDMHAQDEKANASAMMHMLWDTIGDSYPGNPYYSTGTQVRPPSQVPLYGDDGSLLVADDGTLLADDGAVVADDEMPVADDQATVADDGGGVAAN
jgi:hypothetical protein